MSNFFPSSPQIDGRTTYEIFKHLSHKDLMTIRAVCKDWKCVAEGVLEKLVHRVFEETAKYYPEKAALYFERETLSYLELNQYANQLARYLQNLQLSPDLPMAYANVSATVRIGIFVQQGFEFTIAMLAIMKAGYVFIPIPNDNENSLTRLQYIIEDAKPHVILMSKKQAEIIDTLKGSHECHVIFFEDIEYYLNTLSKENISTDIIPSDLAYIIYTSGSTGKPKGVMTRHIGLLNCMHTIKYQFNIDENSKILQFASHGFDANIMERFLALLYGGTLYLIPQAIRLEPRALTLYIQEKQISFAILTPSVLSLFEENKFPTLMGIISTGEKVYEKIIHQLAGNILFGNGYGQTEVTIATLVAILQANQPIHIGNQPIWGLAAYVLEILESKDDPSTIYAPKLAGPGKEGELYVTGKGVGPGYWNNENLTRERFHWIINPKNPNEKLFAFPTRDKARLTYVEDRYQIQIVGRLDRQIKIHGKLIHLDEIQELLTNYEISSQGKKIKPISHVYVDAVSLQEERPLLLVAFLFIKKKLELSLDLEEINQFVYQHLTHTMIPTRWVLLPKSSVVNVLNGSQKIDRQKLWEYWWINRIHYCLKLCQGYRKPRIHLQEENELCQIWNEILYFNDDCCSENPASNSINAEIQCYLKEFEMSYSPKMEDNFFFLGGTSIQLAKLLQRIGRKFNLLITSTEFMNNPTLGYLLRRLHWEKEKNKATARLLIPLNNHYSGDGLVPDGEIPLFFIYSLVGCPLLDYAYFLKTLNSKRPVFGVRAPGLDNPKLMGDSFEEMAEIAIAAIEKIYLGEEIILIGWSGGGLLSLVMRQKLMERGRNVAIIMLDTNSPVTFQKMSENSFDNFFTKLLYGDEKNGIYQRIKPLLTKEQFINHFKRVNRSAPLREKISLLFEGLIDDLESQKGERDAIEDAVGLLTTVESVLLSALKQKIPLMIKHITLFAASDSTKKFGPFLFWPKEWKIQIKSVIGNHFFPQDEQTVRQLHFFEYIDTVIDELKQEKITQINHKIIEKFRGIAKKIKYYEAISIRKPAVEIDCLSYLQFIEASSEEKRELEYSKKIILDNSNVERQELEFYKKNLVINTLLLEDFMQIPSEHGVNFKRRICLKGLSGVGKTSLLRLIFRSWGLKAPWINGYDVVFYIPLNYLFSFNFDDKPARNENDLLAELLFSYLEEEQLKLSESCPLSLKDIKCILLDHTLSKLFLVDGLEDSYELIQDKKKYRLFLILLKQNLVIATSRSDLPIPQFEFDKTISIMGLSNYGIETFIRQRYQKNSDLAIKLNYEFQRYPFLSSMAANLLDLNLLCNIYEEANFSSDQEEMTLMARLNVTYFYQQFEYRILKYQIAKKMDELHVSSLGETNVNQIKKNVRYFLACLAFHATIKGLFLIDRATIDDVMSELLESKQILHTDFYYEVVETGLIKCVGKEPEFINRSCYFIHAKTRAYFTALHLFFAWIEKREIRISNDDESLTVQEFIIKHRFFYRYKQIWQFLCGMLSKRNRSLCNQFFKLLDQGHDITGIYSNLLRFSCLNECLNPKKIASYHEIINELASLFRKTLTQFPRARRFENTILNDITEIVSHCPALFLNSSIPDLILLCLQENNCNLHYQAMSAISIIGLKHPTFVSTCLACFKEEKNYEGQLLSVQAFRTMYVNDELLLIELSQYLLTNTDPFANELRLAVITALLELCQDIKPYLESLVRAVMHQGYASGEDPDTGWRHEMAMQIISARHNTEVTRYLIRLLNNDSESMLLKATAIFLLAKMGGFGEIIFSTNCKLLKLEILALNEKFKADALDDLLYALTKIPLSCKQKEILAEDLARHLLQFDLYSQWALMHTLNLLSQLYLDCPYLLNREKIKTALKEEFGSAEGCNVDYLSLMACMPFFKDVAWQEFDTYLDHENLWNRYGAIEVVGEWKITDENIIQRLIEMGFNDKSEIVRKKSIEVLASIAFARQEIIEQAISYLKNKHKDNIQIGLTILENAWYGHYLAGTVLDNVVATLIDTINKIDYKIPFLRLLLDIILIYPNYFSLSIPYLLLIAAEPREQIEFSLKNENIDYVWQFLSNFDLTDWLYKIQVMLPENFVYSPLLAKTPLLSIISHARKNQDGGLYLLLYKLYNEGIPFVLENNRAVTFEQEEMCQWEFTASATEKLKNISQQWHKNIGNISLSEELHHQFRL